MNILVYPNKILEQPAVPIKNIDEDIIRKADKMFKTMYLYKGIGLAGNQVGLLERLIVIDCSHADTKFKPITIINPVITDEEGVEDGEEGCLSVPGYFAPVRRAQRIQVKAFDIDGKEKVIEAEGILARCLQHEIDHLEGVCFVDRLSTLKKKMFRKKWNKIRPGDIYIPEEETESR